MKVWDLSTRLYHWTQAALFIVLVITGTTEEGPHVELGIALTVLVLWRILWGFWGSETSRFKQFLPSPSNTIRYLLGKTKAGVGHNPAGAWMVLTMLVALLAQCVSGFALAGYFDYLPYAEIWLTDDVFDVLEAIHVYGVTLLQVLVGLHIFAIIVYKLRKKPLVWAMVTGVQSDMESSAPPMMVSQWRALLLLAIAAVVPLVIISL